MPASAALNLIAPSASLPVQALGDVDASAFEGLLSTVLSGEAAPTDTATPRPTTQPLRDAGKTAAAGPADDTTKDSLIDSTGLGLIQTLPPAPVEEAPLVEGEDAPVTLDITDTDTATVPATKTEDQPQVMPLPVVQPAIVAVQTAPAPMAPTAVAAIPVLPDVTAADAAEAALLAAAAEAVTDDAQTLPPAAPEKTAATTPPVPQVQPPAPAPLKPASERTGRAHDGLTREGSDVKTTSDGLTVTTTASGQSATPAPAPGKTAADTGALTSAFAALPGEADLSGDLASDGATPSLDTAKAQAEAAVAHDTSLSTLSRATIDATAQIAAQIIRKLDGKSTRFEMALTPDDLGRVDVKLEIDAEGRLAARLAFDNPAAAADLRGRADELRRQLQDAGFHVPDDAFEFAERDSGSSAFDRGSSDQNNSQRQNRAFTAASRLNAEIDVAQPPRWMSLSLSPSGVDLKV